MSTPSRAGHWRLHTALAVGLVVCTLGFVIELHRGVDGHFLAWAYVVEWPLFAVIGTVMWWMILHEKVGEARDAGQADPATSERTTATAAGPPSTGTVAGADPEHDEQLAAWNAYVARLEAGEPEG